MKIVTYQCDFCDVSSNEEMKKIIVDEHVYHVCDDCFNKFSGLIKEETVEYKQNYYSLYNIINRDEEIIKSCGEHSKGYYIVQEKNGLLKLFEFMPMYSKETELWVSAGGCGEIKISDEIAIDFETSIYKI